MNENQSPPIEGMTKIPYGLPLMFEAWMACVQWAASEDGAIKLFAEKTGLNLKNTLPRSPIERMIDEATGHRKAVFAKFCDFVTEYIWGEEGVGDDPLLDAAEQLATPPLTEPITRG